MKKYTAMLIALIMLFSISLTPTYATTKYVKVKAATYQKYKKAYKKQPTLKKTISDQKITIANQKTTIANQKVEILELEATIKDKKQTISWLWSSLEELGYEYNYDTHKWEVITNE